MKRLLLTNYHPIKRGFCMTIPQHIRQVYANAICLYRKEQVEQALDQMASDIHNKFADANPLFLCVMVGGLIPAAGLLARVDFPLELDYLHVTRYTGKTKGGVLSWKNEPTNP